jgi:hypothetical protein
MKKIKIGVYRKHIERLYWDEFDIYRLTTIKKANNATQNVIPTTPTYSGIPCKISFKPKPDQSSAMTDANNPINQQIKIFCPPDTDIKKGDRLVIRKMSETGEVMDIFKGDTSNKPAVFVGHKEVLFTQEGDA